MSTFQHVGRWWNIEKKQRKGQRERVPDCESRYTTDTRWEINLLSNQAVFALISVNFYLETRTSKNKLREEGKKVKGITLLMRIRLTLSFRFCGQTVHQNNNMESRKQKNNINVAHYRIKTMCRPDIKSSNQVKGKPKTLSFFYIHIVVVWNPQGHILPLCFETVIMFDSSKLACTQTQSMWRHCTDITTIIYVRSIREHDRRDANVIRVVATVDNLPDRTIQFSVKIESVHIWVHDWNETDSKRITTFTHFHKLPRLYSNNNKWPPYYSYIHADCLSNPLTWNLKSGTGMKLSTSWLIDWTSFRITFSLMSST